MKNLEALTFALVALFSFMLWRVLYSCWVLPIRAYRKLAINGFNGPPPSFPLGNTIEMKKTKTTESSSSSSSLTVSNDIHSLVFPYFAQWQKSYGKYMYIATRPSCYVLCMTKNSHMSLTRFFTTLYLDDITYLVPLGLYTRAGSYYYD